jgi:uncharacterized surface protein with fasciclin (FAS1) repeats
MSSLTTVLVGGQAMLPGKTIVANAVNSADHSTLVAAVKAAGLVDTLNGKGPFTVPDAGTILCCLHPRRATLM